MGSGAGTTQGHILDDFVTVRCQGVGSTVAGPEHSEHRDRGGRRGGTKYIRGHEWQRDQMMGGDINVRDT